MMAQQKNDPTDNAPQDHPENPASRRRVLLYAAAPVALLILLMTGVRFVNDAAHHLEAEADAEQRAKLKALRPSDPRTRPTPIPVVTTSADKVTQDALEVVVQGQLTAIREQNFEKALTYSVPGMSKSIRPMEFGDMIRTRYSGMLTARNVVILPAKIQTGLGTGRQAMVETTVETEAGDIVRYGYILVSDGVKWHVGGVIPSPGGMRNEDGNRAPIAREDSPAPVRAL